LDPALRLGIRILSTSLKFSYIHDFDLCLSERTFSTAATLHPSSLATLSIASSRSLWDKPSQPSSSSSRSDPARWKASRGSTRMISSILHCKSVQSWPLPHLSTLLSRRLTAHCHISAESFHSNTPIIDDSGAQLLLLTLATRQSYPSPTVCRVHCSSTPYAIPYAIHQTPDTRHQTPDTRHQTQLSTPLHRTRQSKPCAQLVMLHTPIKLDIT
jgi:hypothetical protein